MIPFTSSVWFEGDSKVVLSFINGFYWKNCAKVYSSEEYKLCCVQELCVALFMPHTSRFSANEDNVFCNFMGHNLQNQVSLPLGLRAVRVICFVASLQRSEGVLCCVVPITS
jgi:hypothetical protein